MFKTINQPTDCEVRAVIRFLSARNTSVAEIHQQIIEVYGPNIMSDSKVRKWVRAFNEGRENVHDEPRSGRPSVISDELVHAVDDKIREDRRFTISDDEVKEAVKDWLSSQAADFYDIGIQKLVERCDQCLNKY